MSTTNRTIAARVACDQFIFAPTNMAVFLSSMAYFEGASPKERLAKAWGPGMKNNFLVWPWVQGVNFKYVPLEHRVFVVNVVALGKFFFFASLYRSGFWGRENAGGVGYQISFCVGKCAFESASWLTNARLELLSQLPEQPGLKQQSDRRKEALWLRCQHLG